MLKDLVHELFDKETTRSYILARYEKEVELAADDEVEPYCEMDEDMAQLVKEIAEDELDNTPDQAMAGGCVQGRLDELGAEAVGDTSSAQGSDSRAQTEEGSCSQDTRSSAEDQAACSGQAQAGCCCG